jgi:hypothetical protein
MRYGDVFWTPPGSEARACSHRGNLGTRDIRLSPCVKDAQRIGSTGKPKALALVVSFRAASESCMEHTKERRHARYRGPTANSEETRDGQMEVLADHSTDGQ